MLSAPQNMVAVIEGPSAGERAIEDARKLTRDNPAAVANIVKSWVNGESPA
jgi:flagellar M-ring protein FliF